MFLVAPVLQLLAEMPDVKAAIYSGSEGHKVLDGGAGDDVVAHPWPALEDMDGPGVGHDLLAGGRGGERLRVHGLVTTTSLGSDNKSGSCLPPQDPK